MNKRLLLTGSAFILATGGYAVWHTSAQANPATPDAPLHEYLRDLPTAAVAVDSARDELVIELPPVDLPGGVNYGIDLPAALVDLPISGAVVGFRAQAVDGNGRELPELLHHVNAMDPTKRELFLPIAQRVLAVGKETGPVRFPWLLFGKRIRAGDRLVVNAMLHNDTDTTYRGVRTRMILSYVPARRPWPLVSIAPWQLDVAFPVGDKSFDLPPGHSERAYVGSPAVAGRLVVIGGHLHDYGQWIELRDVTSGELIWRGEPVRDSLGRVIGRPPISKLFGLTSLGAHITPDHRYEVRVAYDNPTGHVLQAGGMGVVGGLFVPDRSADWPAVNARDTLYEKDLAHFILLGRTERASVGTHAHMH
jgi:hypothetical protein